MKMFKVETRVAFSPALEGGSDGLEPVFDDDPGPATVHLRMENSGLRQLVVELLEKNQRLREALRALEDSSALA